MEWFWAKPICGWIAEKVTKKIDFDEVPGVVRPEPEPTPTFEFTEEKKEDDLGLGLDFELDFSNKEPKPVQVDRVFDMFGDF